MFTSWKEVQGEELACHGQHGITQEARNHQDGSDGTSAAPGQGSRTTQSMTWELRASDFACPHKPQKTHCGIPPSLCPTTARAPHCGSPPSLCPAARASPTRNLGSRGRRRRGCCQQRHRQPPRRSCQEFRPQGSPTCLACARDVSCVSFLSVLSCGPKSELQRCWTKAQFANMLRSSLLRPPPPFMHRTREREVASNRTRSVKKKGWFRFTFPVWSF